MIVKNPTNQDIHVQIFGVQYSVLAHDELAGVPADAAAYWLVRLHSFIQLEEEEVAPVAPSKPSTPVAPVEPAAVVAPVEPTEPVEPVTPPVEAPKAPAKVAATAATVKRAPAKRK